MYEICAECLGLSNIPDGDWICQYCQNLQQKDKILAKNNNAIAAGRVAGVDPIELIIKRCIRIVSPPENDAGVCALCSKLLPAYYSQTPCFNSTSKPMPAYYSQTPCFNLYKLSDNGKIIFDQIAPAKKISIHLNPIDFVAGQFESSEKARSNFSIFTKLKKLCHKKLKGLEQQSNLAMEEISSRVQAMKNVRHKFRSNETGKKVERMRMKWSDGKNIWFPNIRGRSLTRMFINGNMLPWISMLQLSGYKR